MIRLYDREFQTDSLLSVELLAFREGWTPEQGGLGRAKHLERIIREIWPEFIWIPEAYEQADALCNYAVTGFTSGASFMKSDLMGKYALVSWWSDPINTLVIICSTTTVDAKSRVWGHVVRDFRKARAQNKSVGKLIESQSIIKLSEGDDGVAASDNSSICLVAAGDQYKDDALKRLEGRKNKRVILCIDEGQDVSHEIINTALWNLSANDKFEVHMAGNASQRSDAHGVFMTPVEGWTSVNRHTHRWKIRVGLQDGIAIHFDATSENSPNMQRYAQGVPELPFLRKAEALIAAKNALGDQNPVYLRQFVGFWADADSEDDHLINDAMLAAHEAYDKPEWRSAPTNIAGIDPSYGGGDLFIFYHLRYGITTHEVWTIEFYEFIAIKVKPIPGETKDAAAIRQCKELCEKREIPPRFVGIDSSAGNPILSIAHQNWSPEILGVQFGGAPTDLQISQFDKRIAKDMYANKTSELKGVFKEFLQAGQIRGIKPEHAKQCVARKFKIVGGNKIKIEPKDEMKKRVGYSPDIDDGGNIGLTVIRERLHVQAGAAKVVSYGTNDWKALAAKRAVNTLSSGTGGKGPKSLASQVLDSKEYRQAGLARLAAKMLRRS